MLEGLNILYRHIDDVLLLGHETVLTKRNFIKFGPGKY